MEFMAGAPYLVALALVEFAGRRALPLTGRSQAATGLASDDPGEVGQALALELLLRLFQRSDEGPLQRGAAEASLLLVELPLEIMSEQLPQLKATWLSGGETEALLRDLAGIALRGWTLNVAKHEPLRFSPWP